MGWETVPVTRQDEVKKRNFVTTVTSRSICWNPEVPIPDDERILQALFDCVVQNRRGGAITRLGLYFDATAHFRFWG
jgi:hypothetical protein